MMQNGESSTDSIEGIFAGDKEAMKQQKAGHDITSADRTQQRVQTIMNRTQKAEHDAKAAIAKMTGIATTEQSETGVGSHYNPATIEESCPCSDKCDCRTHSKMSVNTPSGGRLLNTK